MNPLTVAMPLVRVVKDCVQYAYTFPRFAVLLLYTS